MSEKEAYVAQLGEMERRAAQWRAMNPQAVVRVQFNFPPRVCVIAPISDAIEQGYVSVNGEGLALIKAMGNWGATTEPTVLMVRAVLEGGRLNEVL